MPRQLAFAVPMTTWRELQEENYKRVPLNTWLKIYMYTDEKKLPKAGERAPKGLEKESANCSQRVSHLFL